MMQKSLTRNSIYNIIYVVANILFPFVTSIYVSRILLPDGVGKVASAQNIASYFVTLAALGLPSYGVREFAKVRECKKEKNQLFTELLLLNIISTTIAVVGFFLLVIINSGFNGEWGLYVSCGLAIFFNYINIDWMYKGLEEYGYITGRSLLIKAISFIMLLLFVKNRSDYVVYAMISSLATGGNYIFNIIHAKKFVKIEFSNLNLKKHLKPVLLIACVIFFSSIYNKIDVTMLNMLANNEAVGYYTYAQKIVNMVITLANAVTATMLPRLSFYYENNKEQFYKLLDKGFQVLCFLTLPLMAGVTLVAAQTVSLMYGEAFLPTYKTIQLMCPLIMIKGFGDLFCYQLVYSTKSEKIILPAAISASVINIVINLILIPRMLENGAVIASVISELATNAIQFAYMKKKLKFKIKYKIIGVSIFNTAVMSICVYLIIRSPIPNNVVSLFAEIICGIVVYMTLNIIMKNNLVIEVLLKLKTRIPKKC